MGAMGYQNHMPLVTTMIILLAPIILAAFNNGSVENTPPYSGAPEESSRRGGFEYRPIEDVQYRVFAPSDGRRRLAPFQLCLACRCCSGGSTDPSLCTTLPCCFGIDCSLPDKPYGVCAFVPKSCNCTACGKSGRQEKVKTVGATAKGPCRNRKKYNSFVSGDHIQKEALCKLHSQVAHAD